MRIKADWTSYLHDLRRQEAELIFRNLPEKTFSHALELGAGDGFVSHILCKHATDLLCTEINQERLLADTLPNVHYQILDAETAGEVLEHGTFDLVFSSNLLEHLPNADKAIKGTFEVLTDDGIAVHVLPSRTWKAASVLCYLPNRLIVIIDKLLAGRLFKRREGHQWGKAFKGSYEGNNQKIGRKKQSRLTKLFLPPIHGVSRHTLAEFAAFGKGVWRRRFEEASFEVITIKMPFSSGYGFGFRRLQRLMEAMGLSSATAFVLRKRKTGLGQRPQKVHSATIVSIM